MPDVPAPLTTVQPTLGQKVAFLSQTRAYPAPADVVIPRETHMSWVFLAGERVYKLKKPVRFSYLDFSTLEKREAACRCELKLNRRLAADVYLDVVPLALADGEMTIGGIGPPVDWLVVMRRLDEARTLEHALLEKRLEDDAIDRLAARLSEFYRTASAVVVPPARHLAEWRQRLLEDRRALSDPRFGLPAGVVRHIDGVLRAFLRRRAVLLARSASHVIDGHGDLRPEHIWLEERIRIIDCLEFNARLRAIDPLDELAYLGLECERLGAAAAGERLRRRVSRALHRDGADDLFLFYRCHRATLRARLAITHLAEPEPRTPEKWPLLARAYLRIAGADARRLARRLRRRADR